MFVDASLYLAVLPLLPVYAHRFHMSTVGSAVLVAAYPMAVPVVSLACVVLVPRVGARRIALASALIMTAATIVFALAPDAPVLDLARFIQGVASGSIWTSSMAWVTENAPAGRRGRESGIVMGMLSAGSIAGPGVGALASWIGVAPAFLLVALVSAVSVAMTAAAPAGAAVARQPGLAGALRRSTRHPATRAALSIAVVDPLAFGAIDVLVPLDLGRLGVATAVLAAALTAGAAIGAVAGPVGGRLVDRVGPIRVALAAGVAIACCPLILAPHPRTAFQLAVVVIASPVFAVAGSAIFPLASTGADATGVAHVVVNGLQGAVWAVGFTVSPMAVGLIAQAVSTEAAFLVAAGLCLPPLWVLARSAGINLRRVA